MVEFAKPEIKSFVEKRCGVVTEFHFKKLDILNPNYRFIQFSDIEIFTIFRYKNRWMTKCGFQSAQVRRDKSFEFLSPDTFVFSFFPFKIGEIGY